MNQREFHNALRILRCIDYREVSWMSLGQWVSFRDHPYEFVIRCDDDAYDRIWAVIEGRQSAAAMRAEDDAEVRKPDAYDRAVQRRGEGLVRALKRIASPLGCGCKPCRGECRSAEALSIEIEGMKDEAGAALALAGTTP